MRESRQATAAQAREAASIAVRGWPDSYLRDYAAHSLDDRRDIAPSFVPSAWRDAAGGPVYAIVFKPAAFLAALDRAARAACKARGLDPGRLPVPKRKGNGNGKPAAPAPSGPITAEYGPYSGRYWRLVGDASSESPAGWYAKSSQRGGPWRWYTITSPAVQVGPAEWSRAIREWNKARKGKG